MKKGLLPLVILLLIFSVNSKAQFSTNNDSIISEAIAHINYDSIEYQLQWLQDMGTRFLMATNHKQVSLDIKARFESYGITDVKLDSFQCYTNINYGILLYDTTTWQYNVEARITGSVYPEEEIIVMGHHDNVQLDSDPEIFTPGADDNASGTVAALETARVIMEMGYQPERTIVFLTTAAEELMNFGDAGSEHYAAQAQASGQDIWGVINNDMIAYDNGSNIMTLSNVIGSEEITGVAELITNTYTTLTPMVSDPQPTSGADLKPFIEAGYRGVYLMEAVFNPYYHSAQDLVENCDMEYLTEAIKITCGTVLYTDLTVGVENELEDDIQVSVFPNPTSDKLNIKLSGNNNPAKVILTNIAGQFVYSSTIMANQNLVGIDLSSQAPGLYILSIYNDEDIVKYKVIKE